MNSGGMIRCHASTGKNVPADQMIAFGPVPSRRLGCSLGINHIPPKICTFACIYCQLGRTIKLQGEREPFYRPERIAREVQDKVESAGTAGETIDYLTFVPDGEPTLDINLGRAIELLRPLGVRIAVISNASLIWREDVRAELALADWVSLKVDSTWETVWRRIDRPYGRLALAAILEGILEFARTYQGRLVTETMLVRGVNDGNDQLRDLASFLALVQPDAAYLAIPTRPPAEAWVQAPAEDTINRAYQLLSEKLSGVEYLIGYEGNAFASTGDIETDLLSITAVHPMREEAVLHLLERRQVGWSLVENLIAQGQLIAIDYQGRKFFMRKLAHVPR